MTNQELRKKIWGSLPCWSHPPEPCTAKAPCELCKRSIDLLVQLIAEREREAQTELASRIDGLATKYNLPSITSWRQGHFIDHSKYKHMSVDWKNEQYRREATLIRPYGGINNALFSVEGNQEPWLVTEYLQELGNYIAALTNKPKQEQK